nr:uncharacterized protein LOC104104188 isoform X2 [Nicotiana tomentosiformis]
MRACCNFKNFGNMISRLIMVVALVGSLVCGISGEGTYSKKLFGGGIDPVLSGADPLPFGMNDFPAGQSNSPFDYGPVFGRDNVLPSGENYHPGSRQPSDPFGGMNDLPDQSNSPFDYRPVGDYLPGSSLFGMNDLPL